MRSGRKRPDFHKAKGGGGGPKSGKDGRLHSGIWGQQAGSCMAPLVSPTRASKVQVKKRGSRFKDTRRCKRLPNWKACPTLRKKTVAMHDEIGRESWFGGGYAQIGNEWGGKRFIARSKSAHNHLRSKGFTLIRRGR